MPATQPTLFIPHGAGPCFFMDWPPAGTWDAMEAYLRGIAATLPERPRALLVVTSHWQDAAFRVSTAAQPELVFDYYGFPAHTYELSYPAPGEPVLAQQVVERLQAAGLDAVADAERGFDHGTFIPLMLMFPDAEIPVVQMSLRRDLDPAAHLQAGAALAALREQGVLIIGSGMSFHNMRAGGDPRFVPIAEDFDNWLNAAVGAEPEQCRVALKTWEQAPHARLCHPPRAEEHLLPLMVAAGAAGQDRGRQTYRERINGITLSGYQFG
ncbi:DODA-type extradiol aromatic ring-opening family dioxygenase [Marinobacterium weihaiense]|uniref:Dioxygenase n=1 Tax=Marinobacterium weihaiense TaxID=2851016 RepID=A0ABS6MAS5_9GAMM|nr:class III extradiol ring-cleavage dioxygenase [Marinobacterium weihaiense]MBV0933340.1 dioxygenase [Marinobacterium weihaiense]